MYCNNCNNPISGNSKFCSKCGFNVAQKSGVKRKRRTGLIVTLAVLVIILGAAFWFLGKLMFFGPRDLGVRYTEEDFKSAMSKTGVVISFEGMSQEEYEEYRKSVKTKSSIHDYNYEFSDYQKKSFQLTPQEATALLNEIAPGLWWFDNLQVNVLPDGTMVGSSTADVRRLKTDLYPDIADSIPIPLPNSVNIYSKGTISINNNRLSGDPQEFFVGPVSINNLLTDEAVSSMETYFERIYTVVPQMEINALGSKDGNFYFDGYIPQKVTVTKK